MPKSAKCPICGDTVHEGMLKSVKYLDAATMLAASQGSDGDDHDTNTPHVVSAGGEHGAATADHGMVMGEMDGFEEAQAVDAVTEGEKPPKIGRSGHRIHMRLIQRPQMTTLALPASATWPSEAIPPLTAPWYFLPDVLSYSRFMMATPEYMLEELDRELAELKSEWDNLRGDDLGRDFVRAAKEKVERQVGKVKAELMTEMVKKSERDSREAWAEAVGGERLEREKRKERERRAKEREEKAAAQPVLRADEIPSEMLAAQGDHGFGFAQPNPNVDIPPNLPVTPNPMPPGSSRKARRRGNANSSAHVNPVPAGPSYSFYQSSLGANVFLHPLDIRILLAHFKSYSLFPPTLSFASTGFDPGTINDELRKRCKYLAHLPTGTEVIFVEADLEEIVGKEGLAAFEQPLKARREKRRAKVKREDKAKSRWEKAERDKLPMTPVPTPGEDREFALALARSTIETTWADEPVLGNPPVRPGSLGSSSSYLPPSPGTSPVAGGGWGGPAPASTRSWASTLTSSARPSGPAARRDQQADEWQVEAAWERFGGMSLEAQEAMAGDVKESQKGGETNTGGRKGKKGGKKTTLVLGGGGGRRA